MGFMAPIVGHSFLEDLALVLCVAAVATVLFQLLRQPLVVGYLVAGMAGRPLHPAANLRQPGADRANL